jgi:hypothetical protein
MDDVFDCSSIISFLAIAFSEFAVWPERKLAGNAIDFFVQVLGTTRARLLGHKT